MSKLHMRKLHTIISCVLCASCTHAVNAQMKHNQVAYKQNVYKLSAIICALCALCAHAMNAQMEYSNKEPQVSCLLNVSCFVHIISSLSATAILRFQYFESSKQLLNLQVTKKLANTHKTCARSKIAAEIASYG